MYFIKEYLPKKIEQNYRRRNNNSKYTINMKNSYGFAYINTIHLYEKENFSYDIIINEKRCINKY